MLAYLSRYTHRIAIANSRLVAFDGTRVTFKWKDYRAKADARYKLMTLDVNEFIRRFLIHVLPDGFHRIRHYGLFANANRTGNIALARRLLGVPDPALSSGESDDTENRHEDDEWNACPCCGGRHRHAQGVRQPGGAGAHSRAYRRYQPVLARHGDKTPVAGPTRQRRGKPGNDPCRQG